MLLQHLVRTGSILYLSLFVLRVAPITAASVGDTREHAHGQVDLPVFGTIEGRLYYPHDRSGYNATVRVTLNHGQLSTYNRVDDDSRFTLRDIPPGVHVIDVYSTIHHFPQIKVQLLPNQMNQPQCLRYLYPGSPKEVLDCTMLLEIPVVGAYDYFEKRSQFSAFQILKNPMVIMMLFSVGLMVLMPRMMEGLDPEEKAQMRQQMELQQDPAKMLGQFFGIGDEAAATPSAATITTNPRGGTHTGNDKSAARKTRT